MNHIIEKDQYPFFETFLQYGDLEEAEYIFMGYEEGIDKQKIEDNIKGRLNWFNSISEHIKFINGKDISEGYYIDDRLVADQARNAYSNPEFTMDQQENKIPAVIRFEAKLMLLIKTNMKFLYNSDKIKKETIKKYVKEELERKNSKTAMIDYYPLPSREKKDWDYENLFKTKKEYQQSIDNESSQRRIILKNIYDKYPCKVTICYAGTGKHKPIEAFFVDQLGFTVFKEIKHNEVHPNYIDYVNKGQIAFGDKQKQNIRFLKREKINGDKQWLVVTPFFGQGQITDAMIANIASWILTM